MIAHGVLLVQRRSRRTVACVSVEEHVGNYRAARALMGGKGKSSAKKSAVKNGAKGMSDMAG